MAADVTAADATAAAATAVAAGPRTWPQQWEAGGSGGGAWSAAAVAFLVMAAVAGAGAAAQRGDGDSPAALIFRRERAPYKAYSGLRRDARAPRQVYFHEQTVAVVELGPGQQLLNCELIEVVTPAIAKEALKNLTNINKPIAISFKDMQLLMYQCKDFEAPDGSVKRSLDEPTSTKVNPWTVLTGILPGTKWCGNGDLAMNYFDLGYLADVDKCCRAHDICPIKVRGFQNRYNLMNFSFYTKSHCDCDSTFYQCLKTQKHPTANLMGTIYFNLLRVPCIEDFPTTNSTHNDGNPKTKTVRRFRNPLHIY